MSMHGLTGKQQKSRPIARLNRAILAKIAECPSSSSAFTTANGRATRKSFVKDICKVMTLLVDEMSVRCRKIGRATRAGFSVRSWGFVAEKTGLPLWRVKQCVDYAKDRGWITSTQPRERYTGKDNKEQWRGLVSIKRITEDYFKDLGIYEQYLKAKEANKDWIKALARRLERPVKYILTPITLLRRRRKEASERRISEPPVLT